jgi:hypothetical protein
MGIKTIHLENDDVIKRKALIKELYDHTLKDDPDFHFFFEPALIVRITTEDCLTKTKNFLQARRIEFEEYDYPHPVPLEGKFGSRFGEAGIVADNLEIFLLLFHSHSVAALTMSEDNHFKYLERVIHTAFNPRGLDHAQEGLQLLQLAALKLGYRLGYQLLPDK